MYGLEFNQNFPRVQIRELDSHELTTKSLITNYSFFQCSYFVVPYINSPIVFEKKQCSTVCIQSIHGIWVVLGMFEILGSVCWQDFTCPPRRLTVRVQMKMPSAQVWIHQDSTQTLLELSGCTCKPSSINASRTLRTPLRNHKFCQSQREIYGLQYLIFTYIL